MLFSFSVSPSVLHDVIYCIAYHTRIEPDPIISYLKLHCAVTPPSLDAVRALCRVDNAAHTPTENGLVTVCWVCEGPRQQEPDGVLLRSIVTKTLPYSSFLKLPIADFTYSKCCGQVMHDTCFQSFLQESHRWPKTCPVCGTHFSMGEVDFDRDIEEGFHEDDGPFRTQLWSAALPLQ